TVDRCRAMSRTRHFVPSWNGSTIGLETNSTRGFTAAPWLSSPQSASSSGKPVRWGEEDGRLSMTNVGRAATNRRHSFTDNGNVQARWLCGDGRAADHGYL